MEIEKKRREMKERRKIRRRENVRHLQLPFRDKTFFEIERDPYLILRVVRLSSP